MITLIREYQIAIHRVIKLYQEDLITCFKDDKFFADFPIMCFASYYCKNKEDGYFCRNGTITTLANGSSEILDERAWYTSKEDFENCHRTLLERTKVLRFRLVGAL